MKILPKLFKLQLLILLAVSCRERKPSAPLAQDRPPATRSANPDTLSLTVRYEEIAKAKWTLSAGGAELMISVDANPSRGPAPQNSDAFASLKPTQIPDAAIPKLPPPTLSVSRASTLMISSMSGVEDGKTIDIIRGDTLHRVRIRDLSINLFRSCPYQLTNENPLLRPIFTTSGATIKENRPPIVNTLEISENALSWNLSCEFNIETSSERPASLTARLNYKLSLRTDSVLFPDAVLTSKLKQDVLTAGRPKWDMATSTLVIDDVSDAYGTALIATTGGSWLTESLRIATADLRLKSPKLGKRVRLKSEGAAEPASILFRWIGADDERLPDVHMVHAGSRQKIKTILSVENPDHSRTLRAISSWFRDHGLIENADNAAKESFQLNIIEKLGSALGLSYQLNGYGFYNNWGDDLQTVMSFGFVAMPPEYLTDKIEFKSFDIRALQYLYQVSESDSGPAVAGSELAPESCLYPEAHRYLHLSDALNYLAATNHPKIKRLRETTPDWRERLRKLYSDTYGIAVQ